MQTRFIALFFSVLLTTGSCYSQSTERQLTGSASAARYAIIPRPAQLEPRSGDFVISRTTTIMVPFTQPELKAIVDTFANHINRVSGIGVSVRTVNKMAL